MITFKDCMPENNDDDFGVLVERVNNFVHDKGVRVINVETILMPELDQTTDTEMYVEKESTWSQFVRLWYDA